MTAATLPEDVLVLVMQFLDLPDLVALAKTSRFLRDLVNESGWSTYVRLNPRPSSSLTPALAVWTPQLQARYHTLADRAWEHEEFVARPLARPWHGKLQPLLATSPSRLVIAAGYIIYTYVFSFHGRTMDPEAPGVHAECTFILESPAEDIVQGDITSLAFIPDGGRDQTLCVGFADGTLEYIVLPLSKLSTGQPNPIPIHASLRAPYAISTGGLVRSLSAAADRLLALSHTGTATLFDASPPDTEPSTIAPAHLALGTRSWCAYLSFRGPAPYAAFGTSARAPLAVHALSSTGFSPTPMAVLGPSTHNAPTARASAVYGLCAAPPGAPWGASDQVLVSGWYDGFVRVHDMRTSGRSASATAAGAASTPGPLLPVLSLADPWSFEPIYAVAAGGGSAAHIAAGSARHAVVAFWDVRAPRAGFSVHAPGNDPSPVYSLALESSRLFGATQSRPFVYDFGPGVTRRTYDPLTGGGGFGGGQDGLMKLRRNGWDGVRYYVTKYNHAHSY